jgi:hypothetical protein
MKQHYRIGTVLRFNGKNYEVVEGSGDDKYNACGKCAMFGGTPGSCVLSAYDDLKASCSSLSRPDGKEIHYILTDKTPFVFYGKKPDNENFSKPMESEKMTVDESAIQVTNNHGEQMELFDKAENNTPTLTNIEEFNNKCIQENMQEPIKPSSNAQLNVVRAKSADGKTVEGLLITTEDGSKYIMPYGTKVLMDGTCNLVKFDEATLSYMTHFKDMNGKRIYTGDILKVATFGNFTNKYKIYTVDVQKRGVAPLFYIHGTNEHFDDVSLVDDTVINGFVIDGNDSNENVKEWFASVMDSVSKTIGNGSDIGTEEYKALYKMFLIDDYLKKQ